MYSTSHIHAWAHANDIHSVTTNTDMVTFTATLCYRDRIYCLDSVCGKLWWCLLDETWSRRRWRFLPGGAREHDIKLSRRPLTAFAATCTALCSVPSNTIFTAIALKIFGNPWLYPRLLFPNFLMGFKFLLVDAGNMCTKFVALPVPGIIAIGVLGGVANPQSWGRRGRGWYRSIKRWWVSIGPPK